MLSCPPSPSNTNPPLFLSFLSCAGEEEEEEEEEPFSYLGSGLSKIRVSFRPLSLLCSGSLSLSHGGWEECVYSGVNSSSRRRSYGPKVPVLFCQSLQP